MVRRSQLHEIFYNLTDWRVKPNPFGGGSSKSNMQGSCPVVPLPKYFSISGSVFMLWKMGCQEKKYSKLYCTEWFGLRKIFKDIFQAYRSSVDGSTWIGNDVSFQASSSKVVIIYSIKLFGSEVARGKGCLRITMPDRRFIYKAYFSSCLVIINHTGRTIIQTYMPII